MSIPYLAASMAVAYTDIFVRHPQMYTSVMSLERRANSKEVELKAE
jgi:hypothetical protein